MGEAQGWSISHDPFILAGTENGQHWANAVGNYFISSRPAAYAFHKGTSNFSLYFENNLLDGNANGSLDSSKADTSMIEGLPSLLQARMTSPAVTTQTPAEAYALVLDGVGASRPARDETDQLLIAQVESQSGFLIQSEQDLIALGVGDDGYGSLPEVEREADFRQRRRRHAGYVGASKRARSGGSRRPQPRPQSGRLHEPRRLSGHPGAMTAP